MCIRCLKAKEKPTFWISCCTFVQSLTCSCKCFWRFVRSEKVLLNVMCSNEELFIVAVCCFFFESNRICFRKTNNREVRFNLKSTRCWWVLHNNALYRWWRTIFCAFQVQWKTYSQQTRCPTTSYFWKYHSKCCSRCHQIFFFLFLTDSVTLQIGIICKNKNISHTYERIIANYPQSRSVVLSLIPILLLLPINKCVLCYVPM